MSDRPKVTILNIDGEDSRRHLISQILQDAGFDVKEAVSGGDALRLVKESPDLIILHVNLLDMSGFEVCKRIKMNPTTYLIPVLHLSTPPVQGKDRVQGLESGADSYLREPVEPEELIAAVKTLLQARQIEKRLQAEALQWEVAFDAISESVCLVDAEGRVLRCNRAMINLLARPPGEILDRTWFELVYGTPDPPDECPFRLMRETHRRETIDLPLGDRWFHVTANPILDGVSVLVGGVIVMTDITERKWAEECIQFQAEILSQVNDAIVTIDKEHRITFWNKGAERLYNFRSEEMVGRRLEEVFPCGWLKPENERVAYKSSAAAGSRYGENIHIKKGGERIYVESSISALRDESGDVVGLLAVIRDISKRKQAEERLRQQNEYLTALHETTLDLMNRLKLDDLLEAIVRRAGALVGTEHGSVYLIEAGEMVAKVGVGICSQFVGHRVKPGKGIIGRVWQTGQPLAVEDYRTWPHRLPDPRFDVIHAALAVPLKSGSEVVGMIGLDSLEEGWRFGTDELELLSQFAVLASLALDNARLYTLARRELDAKRLSR